MSEYIVDDRGEVVDEIIRCRDCKHWEAVRMSYGTEQHRCSGVFAFVAPDSDGFCAWGERDDR